MHVLWFYFTIVFNCSFFVYLFYLSKSELWEHECRCFCLSFIGIEIVRVQLEDETHSTSDTHVDVSCMSNYIDSWCQCIQGECQIFKDASDFQNHVKNYVVATRWSFSYEKNDREKIIVVCRAENCAWTMYASKHKSDDSFGIKIYNLTHLVVPTIYGLEDILNLIQLGYLTWWMISWGEIHNIVQL